MEQVAKNLKVDRDEGVVLWKGHILGIFEDPGEVTLFVEPEDYETNGFSDEETPHAETVAEVEDHLVLGYCLRVQREPWPGRRGL